MSAISHLDRLLGRAINALHESDDNAVLDVVNEFHSIAKAKIHEVQVKAKEAEYHRTRHIDTLESMAGLIQSGAVIVAEPVTVDLCDTEVIGRVKGLDPHATDEGSDEFEVWRDSGGDHRPDGAHAASDVNGSDLSALDGGD